MSSGVTSHNTNMNVLEPKFSQIIQFDGTKFITLCTLKVQVANQENWTYGSPTLITS